MVSHMAATNRIYDAIAFRAELLAENHSHLAGELILWRIKTPTHLLIGYLVAGRWLTSLYAIHARPRPNRSSAIATTARITRTRRLSGSIGMAPA